MHQQRMPRRHQSPHDAAQFPHARTPGSQSPPGFRADGHR
jgi:hypothetical protein